MVGSPNAPGDADLQVLYDAVWKAYVEEPQESSSASINGEIRAASVSSSELYLFCVWSSIS